MTGEVCDTVSMAAGDDASTSAVRARLSVALNEVSKEKKIKMEEKESSVEWEREGKWS